MLQNDIRASERSADELDDRLTNTHELAMDRLDLEGLVQNVISLVSKLLDISDRFINLPHDEPEIQRFEAEWSGCMRAVEKLAKHAMLLIERFETKEPAHPIMSKTDLKKLQKQVRAINLFPLASIRRAKREIKEGKLTPLSAIKNAL